MSHDFIFRVTAYHGEPIFINGCPTRAGLSTDTPISAGRVVNDPYGIPWRDNNNGSRETDYGIDALVHDFETEYDCKVNIPDTAHAPGEPRVFEFDVFEPTWLDDGEAKDVIDDLATRLVDWAEGYPTGR
jgi:hypothetical protein